VPVGPWALDLSCQAGFDPTFQSSQLGQLKVRCCPIGWRRVPEWLHDIVTEWDSVTPDFVTNSSTVQADGQATASPPSPPPLRGRLPRTRSRHSVSPLHAVCVGGACMRKQCLSPEEDEEGTTRGTHATTLTQRCNGPQPTKDPLQGLCLPPADACI
jgi:hypothetical protein